MRVVASRLERFARHAAEAVCSAVAGWSRREGLLLELADDRGATGTGEASPLPGYSPDDLGTARAQIEAWTQTLPLELDDCLPLPAQIERAGRQWRLGPSARNAIEGALLDLSARRAGVPLAGLLAGRPPREGVELQALIPRAVPELQLERARREMRAGYRSLKIKLDAEPKEGARLAQLARGELGDEVRLRFDVNGSWSVEQAREALPLFAASRPEYVEQPVSAADLPRLGRGAVPLAADESLRDPRGAGQLLARGEVAVFVLKPMVLGGSLRCLRLARDARRRGIGAVVSHAFGGPVEWLHAVHLSLALAAEGPLRPCGLAPHVFLHESDDLARLVDTGTVRPWPAAGLGARAGLE